MFGARPRELARKGNGTDGTGPSTCRCPVNSHLAAGGGCRGGSLMAAPPPPPLLEPTRSCVTRRVFQQRSSPLEEETDQLPASVVESSARYYHGLIRIGRKGRVFPRVIRIFAAEQCERSKNDRIFIYEAAEYEM